tara:strand:+ start:32637 stop:32939 length:303 start_codon:yes stop_codon:yes gene_type:complete
MDIQELKELNSKCRSLINKINKDLLYYELCKDFLKLMDLPEGMLEEVMSEVDDKDLSEVKDFLTSNIKSALSKDIGNFISGRNKDPYTLRFLIVLKKKVE